MRAETVNLSWWNRPIGYNINCGKSIPEWKRESLQNSINTMTPLVVASAGSGVLGIILSFLGFSNDKKGLGLVGLLGCLASVGGFIYDLISTNNILASEPNSASSPVREEPRESSQLPKKEILPVGSGVPVSKDNPFFRKDGLCTSDPDVLIVDIYHGILSGDVKKIQDVIDRAKKLELQKIKPLLNNKLQEVRVVAVLSLISRDDYDSNLEVKQTLLELAKKDGLVLKTIRNLALTEKDNKIIFDRLISLLILIGK